MLSVGVKKELRDFTLDVSLSVREGETLILIGENGAGKSTVLSLVSGLLSPDRGVITLGDRVLFSAPGRINVPPERRNIGHLFQSYALFPHLSVFENVAFGLRCRNLGKQEIVRKVGEFLEGMDLASLSGEPAGRLSGGQRQRVALARALVLEPDLLLLDEPLAALDVKSRVSMRKELKESIAAAGIPAVIVSHHFEDALALGDQVCLMEQGRITARGSPRDLMTVKNNAFISSFFCHCETCRDR
ncbi:ABC-type sulfate/molybdate transport systems ATPase subunit [Methanolinea mesophila]|uniref:ABC transporter ATP-binding protein n=1 Tax=Methanolinea mesophila TaxID=547055 RepID=UPI001AE85A06|nr:ATP-binding cassette domain-containing protein [Methanolinea mesophila]MBP1928306.1 ABC-type sulfate/molybdate transport systems ATPase subunit [Methanolinea mesophila]